MGCMDSSPHPVNQINRLVGQIPSINKALPLPSLALSTVVSRDGRSVYASSDTLFKGAVFGRDSLEVADDLLSVKPGLAHNILLTMGRLQGLENNGTNEEQPGKIVHEYRQTELDGKPIDSTSMQIFQELARKWGGTDSELAYYGSVDATPHFMRTLGAYCLRHGTAILSESVIQRDGNKVDMLHVAAGATTWLLGQLANAKSGLLEYKKLNPHGISNQVWKDSEEFYVHEDGQQANHNRPIASIEVQGLAYDALITAAQLWPDQSTDYTSRAHTLRDQTIKYLWQPDRRYFALGLDYDSENKLRTITTPTANPAALLDTGFFDDLPTEDRRHYVSALVERITSKDFLTNGGVRSRSLDMAHLVPFWDYHGSYVSWPKETYDIAKGMRRQGFDSLSRQLENRLLNIVLKTREYPEFVYVDGWGRLLTGKPSTHAHGNIVFVQGTNVPERLQAWTVSALMAIVSGRGRAGSNGKKTAAVMPWQHDLQNRIMSHIPHVDVHINPLKLWLQYPTHKYHLSGRNNGSVS